MKIVHLQHGDPDLWVALGEMLVARSVHKELGGPIYSATGNHWWVTRERGDVIGFASLRPTDSAVWHDYGYVVEAARHRGVHAELADARDAFAAATWPGLPARIVVRDKRWKHYKKRGWQVERQRGSWVYGIREAAP